VKATGIKISELVKLVRISNAGGRAGGTALRVHALFRTALFYPPPEKTF